MKNHSGALSLEEYRVPIEIPMFFFIPPFLSCCMPSLSTSAVLGPTGGKNITENPNLQKRSKCGFTAVPCGTKARFEQKLGSNKARFEQTLGSNTARFEQKLGSNKGSVRTKLASNISLFGTAPRRPTRSERPPCGIQLGFWRHRIICRTRVSALYFQIKLGTMHHNIISQVQQ